MNFFLAPSIAYVFILSFQKYVCDKCRIQFTEKRNLTRHMKTHVHSSQTYFCNICGNEFSRPDNKKRHEESHNYTITCPVCGQYLFRRANMLRHRALYKRPEAKQRPPMKRPASPGPSNSPPKRPHIHSPQSSNSPFIRQPSVQDESQILPEDPRSVSYI